MPQLPQHNRSPYFGGSGPNLGNRIKAIADIMERAQLNESGLQRVDAQYGGDQDKINALKYKENQMLTRLNKISDDSLQMLNMQPPAYMANLATGPSANFRRSMSRLDNLAVRNAQIEEPFIGLKSYGSGSLLEEPLRKAAQQMLELNLGPQQTMAAGSALRSIQRNRNQGAGYDILSQFLSTKGPGRQGKFIRNQMNPAALQAAYTTSAPSLIGARIMSDSGQLTLKKDLFYRSAGFLALDPQDQIGLNNYIENDITHPDAMDEVSNVFERGGVDELNKQKDSIKSLQSLAGRRKLTTAETINRFNFNRTTRGQIHAFSNLFTGVKTGEVTPEGFLITMGLQGAQKGADFLRNSIPLALSSGGQGLTASGGLAALTGQTGAFRTLRGVGAGDELLPSIIQAFKSGRSTQEMAANYSSMVKAGVNPDVIKSLQELSSSGVMGQSSDTIQALLGGIQASGGITGGTNLGTLLPVINASNPQGTAAERANFALASTAAGGGASNYGNVLSMGLVSGLGPQKTFEGAQGGASSFIFAQGFKKLFKGVPPWIQPLILQSMGVSDPLAQQKIIADSNPGTGFGPGAPDTTSPFISSQLGSALSKTGAATSPDVAASHISASDVLANVPDNIRSQFNDQAWEQGLERTVNPATGKTFTKEEATAAVNKSSGGGGTPHVIVDNLPDRIKDTGANIGRFFRGGN